MSQFAADADDDCLGKFFEKHGIKSDYAASSARRPRRRAHSADSSGGGGGGGARSYSAPSTPEQDATAAEPIDRAEEEEHSELERLYRHLGSSSAASLSSPEITEASTATTTTTTATAPPPPPPPAADAGSSGKRKRAEPEAADQRSASIEHFMDPGQADEDEQQNKKKKAKKPPAGAKKKKGDADDGDAAEKGPIKYVPMSELTRINNETLYGVSAADAAEIDLENTSCEELEKEQIARELRRDRGLNRPRRRCSAKQRNKRRAERLSKQPAAFSASADSASLAHFARHGGGGGGGSSCGPACSSDDDDDDDDDDEGGIVSSSGDMFFDQPLNDPLAQATRRSAVTAAQSVPSTATAVGRITRCFLCGWGRDEYALVDNEHIKELFRILYSKPGTDLRIIALTAHEFYKSVIFRDAVLRRQQLPIWRSRDIYVCLTQHKKEPKIRLQIDLQRVGQIKDMLNSMCFFRASDGSVHPHLKNLREFRDMTNMYWKLMEKDMTRMNFHQPELNIQFAEAEYRAHHVRVVQRQIVRNSYIK